MDGFENKGQILGFICNQAGIDGNSVGKIDLFDSFAFLGVEDGVGEKIIGEMNGKTIESRDVRVEFSKDKPRGGGGSERRSGERREGGRRERKDFAGSKGNPRNNRSRNRY